HTRRGAGALLADDGEIATVFLLLAVELGPDRVRAVAAGGQEANEDLLAQRGRPSRPPRQPRAERALAARGEPEQPPRPRAACRRWTRWEAAARRAPCPGLHAGSNASRRRAAGTVFADSRRATAASGQAISIDLDPRACVKTLGDARGSPVARDRRGSVAAR